MPTLIDPLCLPAESPFLREVLGGLSKRRKAIRYKLRQISVDKVRERIDSEEREKLEITCEGNIQKLRLFLWEDRWVFVDARISSKQGWTWEFTHQGRLMGIADARTLVAALEQSIEASSLGDSTTLEGLWRPLLAQGPRPA